MKARFHFLAAAVVTASLAAAAAPSERAPGAAGATIATGRSGSPALSIAHPLAEERVRLIVEFDSSPLAALPATSRAAADRDAFLRRFRADLLALSTPPEDRKRLPATIEHEYFRLYSGAAVTIDPSLADALRVLPYVRRVVADTEVRACVEPGVAATGADRVWASLGTRGAGVTVAIVDSGIDYRHPSLGGGFGPQFKVAGGWDFVNDDADPLDDNGHGTHVAGTVAASSEQLLGVAPDARLLAYKVLNAYGEGSASAILGALERCADPNGDGDLSDRVGVANLSLGGFGTSDDPLSSAVDAAVRLGIVVCVAAGNDGSWQSIGSPGAARLALTVGAADVDGSVASFSSRGPAMGSYGLKPDVVAPGVDVRSTFPGDSFQSLNGTSMATPHVAGIAALLRALHPEWSARDVASRIVATANPIDAPPMTAGAGFVDAYRAASGTTIATPSALGFGPVDLTNPVWTASHRVEIRNTSSVAARYEISATGARAGLSLRADPPSLEIAAGATLAVDVTLTVDNASLPFPDDGSISWGGAIVVDGAGERLRLPWAVVKGCRLRVSYADDAVVTPILLGPGNEARFMQEPRNREFESMVGPGRYDIVLFAMSRTGKPNALVAFENREIAGDLTLAASFESAVNVVEFASRDENGLPFALQSFNGAGCTLNRTIFLPGEPRSWISTLGGPSPDLAVSALSDRYTILASEVCSDEERTRLYSMEYEPVRGVGSPVVRHAGGSELSSRPIDVRLVDALDGPRELSAASTLHIDGTPFAWSSGKSLYLPDARWSGTLFLGPPLDSQAHYAYFSRVGGVTFDDARGVGTLTSYLHPLGDDVLCYDSRTPPPNAYLLRDGEPLVLGAGLSFARLKFVGAASVVAEVSYLGQLAEIVMPLESRLALYDEQQALVAEAPYDLILPPGTPRGRLEAEARTRVIAGLQSTTTLTASLGASESDPYPPALTSLIVLDAGGQLVSERVLRGTSPKLRVSAIDDSGAPARATLRYRATAGDGWTAISLIETGRDYDSDSGHPPVGTTWEADLRPLAATNGVYDVELVVVDAAGNSSTTRISPAIAIGPARSRPARR